MKTLFIIILISFAVSAQAENLSEEQIKLSVLENFQLIQESELKLEAAGENIVAAKGDFDHKLKFKSRNRIEDKYDNDYIETTLTRNTGFKGLEILAGHRQGSGQFAAYDGKYDTSAAGEIFAGISVPLLRNSSTDESRSNLDLAVLEKEQAKLSLEVKKMMSVHKALSLFYKLNLEEKKILIRKNILDLALSRTEMLEKKFKSGDIEQVKLVDNQRSIAKRRDEILKSEIELRKIKAMLSLYLPGSPMQEMVTEKKFDPQLKIEIPRPKIPQSLSMSQIPQVKILENEKRKVEVLRKLFDQQKLPGLGLQVLGAKELSSRQPYDPERIQVGVQFDFPLENRKASGKSTATEYKLRAVDKNLEYTRNELSRTYDFTLSSIDLGIQRLKNVSEEVDNTVKMASVEKTRWTQGSSDLFVVNLREEDVADAEIRKWSAYYEIKQSILDTKLLNATILTETY